MTDRHRKTEPDAPSPFDPTQGLPTALAQRLIRHAALMAPKDLSDRLAEEWQADCGSRSSPVSQVRFALGCCWATRVISREYRFTLSSMVVATKGPALLLGRIDDESRMSLRRSSLFFLAAGLHMVLFYCLMTGFAFRVIAAMPKP